MKIYYVIPPKGVTFKAAAEAQVHFEQGHAWQCTGWAEVNDRGTIVSTCKFNQAIPKRYTEGDQVKLGEDDDDVLHVPNTWAVQWKPGRVTFLRYRVQGGQRKVSLDYGRGRMVDLREERKTSSHETATSHAQVRRDLTTMAQDMECLGGLPTSGGPLFRYTKNGGGRRSNGFDYNELTWLPSGLKDRPEFDLERRCQTSGDRELERFYTSWLKRTYNPYASPQLSAVGGLASGENGYFTRAAPDSDKVTDPGVIHDKGRVGADFTW